MARSISLLWLSLILGYRSSQSLKIKMISKPPEAINAEVELNCETNHPEFGVYWIHQSHGHNPNFILFMSSRSQVTPKSIQGYEASRSGNIYKLKVTSFKNKDEGIYSCMRLHNQVLSFSSGLSVFLPVRTTQAPTTQQRAPGTPNTSANTNEPSKCPDVTAADPFDGLMIPCNSYIWIPLSGVCFVLLITLVMTMIVCCDPRRRRRCQCKRPLPAPNGKPIMTR